MRSHVRRTMPIAVALVGVLAVAGAAPAAETGASHMPPPGALVAPGNPADVTLLYTGDVIGYVDPCG